MVFSATMVAGFSVNIFNREFLSVIFDHGHRIAKFMSPEAAINQVETDLRTTSGSVSLSLSIFIVVQGGVPLLWTAISEIKGRKVGIYFIRHLFAYREAFWMCCLKLVYVMSFAIAMVGCIVAAEAKSIGVLIGMRVIQAIG